MHVVWIEFDDGHMFGPNYLCEKAGRCPQRGGRVLDHFGRIRKSDITADAQQFGALLTYAGVETDGSGVIGRNMWSEFGVQKSVPRTALLLQTISGRRKAEIIQERPL